MDFSANINYRLLHNFLQVAQAPSFRDASGKIHRSTSVVSAQIKQLEQQLGARLFHRTTRSVTLTPEGELLLQAARTATDLRARFVQCDLPTGLGGCDCRSQTGPAGTNDRQLHVRAPLEASQGLHLPSQPQLAQWGEGHPLLEHRELLGLNFAQQSAVDAGHHQARFLVFPVCRG